MAIDYSKWDKLELSDDSDVEVHPNVDKNSFIRWKQRDIHEKRSQREQQIKGLKIQKEMYTHLNERVDNLLENLTDDQLMVESERNSYLNSKFDKSEKCTMEQDSTNDTPTYNEMVEDLFTQITSDLKKDNEEVNGFTIKRKIIEHRQKIEKVLKEIDPKLNEFELEKTQNITSADIHDGWNTSIINKSKDSTTGSSNTTSPVSNTSATTTTTTTTSTKIETLNSPGSKESKQPSKPLDQLSELELLRETVTFSTLDSNKSCCQFILEHPFIASTQQKDALLMKAFDYQLYDDDAAAKSIIYKGMLLQFASDLLENPPYPHMPMDIRLNYVKQFFSQLDQENTPGRLAFDQEYNQMVEHIKKRCEIIKEETEKEGEEEEKVETIQLRSVDENSKLVVTIPTTVDSKEYKIYHALPETMKKALNTGSLDEVNKEFAKMPLEDAENMLEKFNECGVIGIQALLENEEQFKELAENEKKFDKLREATSNINLNDKLQELLEKENSS